MHHLREESVRITGEIVNIATNLEFAELRQDMIASLVVKELLNTESGMTPGEHVLLGAFVAYEIGRTIGNIFDLVESDHLQADGGEDDNPTND